MEEVEGGSHREQHVVVVSLVQDDENQIAYLETEPPPRPQTKDKFRLIITPLRLKERKEIKDLLSNGDFIRVARRHRRHALRHLRGRGAEVSVHR